MQTWTIKALLDWMIPFLTDKGVDAPRLCAEMLVSHVLAKKRIELYTQYDQVVSKPVLEQLRHLVKRASEQEPVAYLVGKTEFYSLEIDVSPACLIPRPETELLVQHGIDCDRSAVTRCRGSDGLFELGGCGRASAGGGRSRAAFPFKQGRKPGAAPIQYRISRWRG